ncbi:MAG: saccharopine dehydrogenase family protein [Candidatus Kariarchaeaceae archaeon]|jgi:lysine 6-dehydrogenase
MSSYVVFGIGMMGEALVYDLLTYDVSCTVSIIEYSQGRIDQIREKWTDWDHRVTYYNLSVEKHQDEILRILEESDVAFGAIDYKFNLLLTEWCIEKGTHFLDLGGNPDVVNAQHALSQDALGKGVTVIPDCGLAPGMANVIASGLLRRMDAPHECHIRVGGLPQEPKGILKYQQVFSIRGLTNEYKEDAIVIRDSEIKTVRSMTELETLHFREPFGEMEAFQTAGGTSSLPELYAGKINELTYKTIRYPGHMQYFRFLLDFDLLSDEKVGEYTPREIIEQKLVDHLPKGGEDVVLIRVFVSGISEGLSKAFVWECIDHPDIFTAMGRTTSYPISIIGQMIANGTISTKGVVPGETAVPFEKFVEELEKRGIVFQQETNLLN